MACSTCLDGNAAEANFCSSCGRGLRRTAEAALATNDPFRLALECAEHAVWEFDIPSRTGLASPGYLRMLGHPPDVYVTPFDRWLEELHPEDRPRVASAFDNYLSGESPDNSAEFRQQTAAGHWIWVQSIGRIVERSESGRPIRVVGTFTDISALKQTQASLEAAQSRLRSALELARVGKWTWEPETGRTWWSEEISSIYGGDPAQIRPRYETYLERLHPEDRARVVEQHELMICGGDRFEFDARIVLPDGQVRWINTIARTVRDADGRLLRLEGTDQDITERKTAELALQASEARFRTFVEHATDAFFLHGEGGIILDVNRRACESLGYTRDELIGRSIAELDPDATEDKLGSLAQRLIAGETVTFESRHQRKSGSEFPVEVRIRPFVEQGRMLAVALARDITERKRAEAALRESEAKLRAIFESDPQCVKVLDAEGRLLEINAAGLAMLGAPSLDDIRGRSVLEMVCPAYRGEYLQGLRENLEGKSTILEFEIVALDGQRRFVQQHAVGLADPKCPDRMTQIVAVTHDVTRRRQAAEQDARRLARLQRLSEAALPLAGEPDVVFEKLLQIVSDVFDVPAVCLSVVNGADLVVRAGVFDGELRKQLARFPLEVTPCGAVAARRELLIFNRVAETFPQATLLRECRAHTYCGAPALDAAGCVRGILFLLDTRPRDFSPEDQHVLRLFGQRVALEFDRERELAARRAAEEELRRSRQRLSEAQRIAHVGDWMWDVVTDSITWSDEVYRIFGYEPQSFVPRYEFEFLQAIPPEDRDRVVEAVKAAVASNAPYLVIHRVVRPDGSERIVREQGEMAYDVDGRPIRMIGTIQDVTDATRALEQMEALRTELAHVARLGMLGEMVAGIAHELNQPLAAIANNAFTVRKTLEKLPFHLSGPLLDSAVSFTREIEGQAVRGGDIIRRLLALLRKSASHRAPADLRRLVDEVLVLLATEIRVSQVEVDIAIPPDLPDVLVDAVQIQQVLLNLIRNAIEAMTGQSRGRCLRISAQPESGGAILVRVQDTGPGLAAAMDGQVFTPFATTKPDGLGFGLAITRRIVEAHGGRIEVRSDVGFGMEIGFTLPRRHFAEEGP